MNRKQNAAVYVAACATAFALTGCAVTPQQAQQQLQDSSRCLTVVVNSVPPGAKVFGAGSGGSVGSLLGRTPLQIRYTHHGVGQFSATAPLEETLETQWQQNVWGNCTSRATFKCYVVEDGYLPYRIYEQVDNSAPAIFQSFNGGHREFTAYLQSQQPVVVAPSSVQQPTQQQAKEGKVAVSCDVEGADVFVDGTFVGNAPATLSLSEGAHTIEVKKAGRGTYKREVRVLAGSETSIRAELSQ